MNSTLPILAGTACAAALATYAALSPSSQLFGETLLAPPDPNQLALTFDDGPNPAATPELLEILARHNIRATFFLIGQYVQREPTLTREIAAAGHTLGNHTMHHPWLPRHPAALIRSELQTCQSTLEDTLGKPVRLFRPPHGARRPAVLKTARDLNLQTVMWNLMVGDWKPRTAEDLHNRIQRGLAANQRRHRGTNLVLHDGSQHNPRMDRSRTIEAVARLLATLPENVSFVTPPRWLECDTI